MLLLPNVKDQARMQADFALLLDQLVYNFKLIDNLG